MTELSTDNGIPSWKDIIKINQDMSPLFKTIHQKDLSLMLLYIKTIVDKNENQNIRDLNKFKLNNLLDIYL